MAPKSKSKSKVNPTLASEIQVTTQQSRFHNDLIALDTPSTKEILIKDLSLTIGDKEILNRTELFLRHDGKYVLVGRNGTGKSTLLKAIADSYIPGIPSALTILLLGQTRELTMEEAIGGLTVEEETVLEHVLRSDRARERLLHENRMLAAAFDSSTDPISAIKAYRQISHERLETMMEQARLIAQRRSGARGVKARQELIRLEAEFSTSEDRLGQDVSAISASDLSLDTQNAADMFSAIQSTLEAIDSSSAEARARLVLLGLGFPLEKIDDSMSKLSGGWRTRCDLACALFQDPDILLLDEPTNFLDLPSVIWLQKYIQELENTTVVVVTHDRDFADATGEDLLILRHQKLETFRGNLSTFEEEKYKKYKYLSNMQEAKDKQKAHIEKTISGNISAAKRSGDDKKLKQAASRKKKLDERWGMEVNAKGNRFKLNRDSPGYYLSNRQSIDIPDFDPPVKIVFPKIPPDLRFPGALVSLEKVSFAYKASGKSRPTILSEIDLTIHPGDRVGLCGLNGSGKTTLVSLIMGSDENGSLILPTSGNITKHARCKMERFSQQVVEKLEAFGKENPQMSSLKHLMEVTDMEEKTARALLSSLGLQGQLASDVPIVALSGGQKVRLALAKVLWNPPHLLVLDEVTTHLDGDTIQSLILALRDYDGALLVVTHDRFFMRTVIEGEHPYSNSNVPGLSDDEDEEADQADEDDNKPPGVVYRVVKGGIRKLDNGMEQYAEIAERAAANLTQKK